MMAFDRHLIAPLDSGLDTSLRPWLIMDDAFEYLQNAYVFRGRVRKRFGSEFMGTTQLSSRLRTSLAAGGAGIGITDISGSAAGNVRTILGDATLPLGAGQAFSIGTEFFTVVDATPGNQNLLDTGGAVIAVFNAANGDFTFTGADFPLTTIFFYPSLPVMGITQYEVNQVNNHPTYAFDTRYAYLFSGGAWDRSGAAVWHGDNLDYFWAANWQSIAGSIVLFVSNFNFTVGAPGANDDPIWSFDGTTWTAASGANAFYFRPNGGAPQTGPYVKTARIIVAFKNRLVLLNTVENANAGGAGVNTNFVTRARYCFYGSPFAVNAWYEKNQSDNVPNVASGGGFVDAATEEQIISAEFIKDRLMVYFERSTWELVYTNNQVLPFVWQKINTELGSQSTFSIVPFDKDVLGIGQSGVHACNGANVVRIDNKIPDEVFEFEQANNAAQRTAGIRDYYTELVYWSFVDDLRQSTQVFPNQVLVYNYKNGSWARFDDCITTFGYFEQTTDITWASSAPLLWNEALYAWNSNVHQAQQRQILIGTPEGFVLILNPEISRNAPSMQITDMAIAATGIITLTIYGHNLTSQPYEFDYDYDFVLLENIVADAQTMLILNGGIFAVDSVLNADTITINTYGALTAGTYAGGGTAARVSNIQIKSKQWNPYVDQDRAFYLQQIDFAVQSTKTGQITVDYYPSASRVSMIQAGVASGSILGTNILETSPYDPLIYPFEQYQDLLHHPIYFQTSGEFIQIAMSFSLQQMLNPNVSLVGFELQGMTLYTQPTSSRLQ
jgi:hypothetical protein